MTAPYPGRETNLYRAAAHMVSAAFLFAAMGVMVKLASRSLPNVMVVFLRNTLGLALLLPWLFRPGAPSLKTDRLKAHVLRGLWGMSAMYCFFYSIAHLRLADAMLLNYSLPLFVPVVARLWLGEPFPRRIWAPLALGVAGLILILKPGTSIFQPAALIGTFGAVLAAAAQVGIRGLTRTEPVTRIVFFFGVIASLVSLGPAALAWKTPQASLLPVLLGMGICATSAQLALTRAYGYAPASKVGPFIYTSVIFAGLLDWMMFGLLPDAAALAGATLVVVASIVTLRLDRPKSSSIKQKLAL